MRAVIRTFGNHCHNKSPWKIFMKNWLITASLVLVCLCVSAHAKADTDEAVIAALQAQVHALIARVERLEGRLEGRLGRREQIAESSLTAPFAPTSAQGSAGPGWTERIKINGDFRYRHETIDTSNSSTRYRQRIRARTALIADVSNTVEVGFGLASGGDDPVSTNQTLGDGSSSKGVRLDLAYMNWKTPVHGLKVMAGKFKNPFHRAGGNSLQWDSDLNPEGGAVTYRSGTFSAIAVGLWLDEVANDDDSFLFGGQLSWEAAIRNGAALNAGLGYYHFADVEGKPVFFDGNPRGNSVDSMGNYLFGYQNVEAFAELTFDLADQPVTLFANYVKNLEADKFDTGYAVGAKMKFMHGSHPWQLAYTYQDLEADAVLGIVTDSDFIGGGTDGSGHILRGSYGVSNKISLNGTLFINERGGDLGIEEDYDRLQLDVSFKY